MTRLDLEARPVQKAFTLIELLLVLAVIAILASLLLPALTRGKSSAQRVKCVGDLRQLGLATQMYWDDNQGSAFRWRGPATNGGQLFWFGWLQDGAEGTRRFDPTFGALYPYVGSHGVEVCPAFNYAATYLKLKATGASYGYGYNLSLSGTADQPAINITKLGKLSDLVLLADAAQINTFQAPASPQNPLLEEFYYVTTNEPTAHFRHSQKANACFGDGHVGAEKPLPDSLDLRLPGQTIGRLRAEILVPE
jgi:prepilin-type N-terminal cleavage/methylation domain-containing protein/prepilin-type processing-associated H-X9-DG protein